VAGGGQQRAAPLALRRRFRPVSFPGRPGAAEVGFGTAKGTGAALSRFSAQAMGGPPRWSRWPLPPLGRSSRSQPADPCSALAPACARWTAGKNPSRFPPAPRFTHNPRATARPPATARRGRAGALNPPPRGVTGEAQAHAHPASPSPYGRRETPRTRGANGRAMRASSSRRRVGRRSSRGCDVERHVNARLRSVKPRGRGGGSGGRGSIGVRNSPAAGRDGPFLAGSPEAQERRRGPAARG